MHPPVKMTGVAAASAPPPHSLITMHYFTGFSGG
jgi:hypothetical protein